MFTGTALIRRPGPTLIEGIVTYKDRVPVDVDLATRHLFADLGYDPVAVDIGSSRSWRRA